MSWITRIFGVKRRERFPDEKPAPTFRENLQALKNIPKFLKMVWETHPGMMSVNIFLRIFQAGIPVSMLYLGKLIIDEVICLSNACESTSPYSIWELVGMEFGLVIFSAILTRSVSLLDALLGDLFSIRSSVK
ncbi:MAG: ABC transporter ATP-binding protein, partial [Bacteroidota bacterium]